MAVRSLGRVLVTLGLAIALAGCGAAGSVNAQLTSGTATASAAAPQTGTVVITRTVLVTSTVFQTVSVGTIAVPAPTTSGTATTETTTAVTSSAAAVTSTESTATAHKTPTPEPNSLPVAGAANVTLAFLAALEKDPSGTSSLQYLSTRLKGVVQSGHSVASIVGIQNMYSHYQAEAAVSRGGGRAATVNITLTYASGPVMRIVTLIPEGGAWRIDDISPTSA
jgi:hypothetical protein